MTRADAPRSAEVPATAGDAPETPWPGAGITAAAMLLAAVAVSAVFSDWLWFAHVAAIVLAVTVSGALLRSIPLVRHTGSAVLGQIVVALVAAAGLAAQETAIAGFIPTPASPGEVAGLLAQGIDDVYTTTPPAESTPGFRAILIVGFGLITILVDGLVEDLRAPKVAGILLLLVYIIPVLLASRQMQWWHFAAIAAAFCLLMLSRYLGRRLRRASLISLLAGATAVCLALAVPLALPEVDERPDGPIGGPDDLTVVNPFLDLRADLTDDDDSPVLTYTSDDPLAPPLRLTSVSEFDGNTWMPKTFDIDPFAVAADGLPRPDGIDASTPAEDRRADVTITGYDGQYLPAPYAPTRAEGVSRRWIYDAETLSIVGSDEIATDQQYGLDYLSVEPTARQLSEAGPVDSEEFADELALPGDFPESVVSEAEDITAGASGPWEAAVMLQNHFRSGEFEYSLDAPAEASGSAIEDFLAEKRGYCVQFSGAMAAMARSVGIPARIGVGFTAGSPTGDGSYEVRLNQAHAWPELYFEGAGWVRFEPTPGGPAGDPPPWTLANAAEEPEPTEEPTDETSSPAPEASDSGEASASPTESADGAAGDETGTAEGGQSGSGLWIALGVIAALLLLAIPALIRIGRRSRRLREPVAPQRLWDELRDVHIDFGAPWEETQTLRQRGDRIAGALDSEEATGAVGDLVDALEAARYGGEAAQSAPTLTRGEASVLVSELRSALGADAGSGRRMAAVLWPASVFRR